MADNGQLGSHAIIVNWTPRSNNLIATFLGLSATTDRTEDGLPEEQIRLTCIGRISKEEAIRSLSGISSSPAMEYIRSSVEEPDFTSILEGLSPWSADAVLILPDHRQSDPDSYSRLICESIQDLAGHQRSVPLIVEIVDPEATTEFTSLDNVHLLDSDSLSANLIGLACLNPTSMTLLGHLIGSGVHVGYVRCSVSGNRVFGDLTQQIRCFKDGTPITVVGFTTERTNHKNQFSQKRHGSWWARMVGLESGPAVHIAPDRDLPLDDIKEVIVLSSREFEDDEFQEILKDQFGME